MAEGCKGCHVRQYFVIFVPISLLKPARADDMESTCKTRACKMVRRGGGDGKERTIPGGLLWLEGAGCAGAQSSWWRREGPRCLSSPPPPAPRVVSRSRPLRGKIMTTLEIMTLCSSPCIISNKPPRQPARRAPWKTVASFEVRASVLFPERFGFNDRCIPCQERNFVMESKLSGYKHNPTAELRCRAVSREQAGLWVWPKWAQGWAQPLPQAEPWG